MRIMIVTDQYPPMVGGVPTVTYGLAVDFANLGHQVWVVAPSYGSRDVRRIEQKVRIYRFSSFEWPFYEGQRIPFLPFMPVRNLIKKTDPDIIHIHSPVVLGNIAQILAGGLRKPVIATNHYLPMNLSRSFADDPVFGKPFSNLTYSYLVSFCNRCDYVTAPTQTALNLLYQHGLHAPAKAISNGLDLRAFTPGSPDPTIRERFNLPADRPIILHVSRLFAEKRIDVLLDAVPKLQTGAHIALVSTGPAEAALRAQVERLQIGDRVSFLGFVRDPDLLALRRSSDLFAFPSEAELQGIAVMEAMACGLPIVAANSWALPELVHHEENGFLFEPGNSDELARYIDTLLQNDDLRAQMGKESLKIVAEHERFQVLEQWETLYHRLSVEFKEVKERRQQMRMLRRSRDYLPQELQDRIRRSDSAPIEEQTWRTRSKKL